MCGRAIVAAANSTVGTPRNSETTIFASLMLSIRCSMVRVFLPYSYTSTKISSLTGNQKCLIFSIFAHEIRSRDPQRRVPCRMSGNFDDREGNAVDPPFEEILILSPRKCFDHEVTPRSSSPSTRNQ